MKRILSLLLVLLLLIPVCPAYADDYDAMLQKAASYAASGEYEKALASLELARRLQPDNEAAYVQEAELHVQLVDYESASAAVSAALEINPVSQEGWYLQCVIDVALGDAAAFDEDSLFAEVCGVDLSGMSLSVAEMYASAGLHEQAAAYFGKIHPDVMTEAQRDLYLTSLLRSGQNDRAVSLGLTPAVVRNEALDAAFEAGTLQLVESTDYMPSASDFEFPDELWAAIDTEKPDDPRKFIEEALSQAKISLASLSPAGNSGFLSINNSPICFYNGKYHIIYPADSRGAADEYGKFQQYSEYLTEHFSMMLGTEGVVYSPDGRYAAIYNTRFTLMNMQWFCDPILIDLSTGEFFLTKTYPAKYKEDQSGAVTTACFSSDNRYFYYMMYGNGGEYKCTLYRYDMQTGSTELCFNGHDNTYWPTLSETPDGSLIILRDKVRNMSFIGIVSLSCKDGTWSAEECDVPCDVWYSNRMTYSANSGCAVLIGSTSDQINRKAFLLVRPSADFDGTDRFIAISTEGDEAKLLSPDDMIALKEASVQINFASGSIPFSSDLKALMSYYDLLDICLSPDGHYALIVACDPMSTSASLLLVRLEDLAVRKVEELDRKQTNNAVIRNMRLLEWNTDTIIIAGDNYMPCRFE